MNVNSPVSAGRSKFFSLMAFIIGLVLAGVTMVQAQAPAPAARGSARPQSPIRPGSYDLEIAFGGGVLEGLLELTASGDSLLAKLEVGGHQSPVRSVKREGAELLLEGAAEGMQVRYRFKFQGDRVEGSFTYDGQDGQVSGKRRVTGS
jgi:hypothetical protein